MRLAAGGWAGVSVARSGQAAVWAERERKRAEGKGRAVSEERVGWAQEKGGVR